MSGTEKKIDEMNYFELLAWLGIGSSHPGGFPATKKNLADLKIQKEDLVLEAGCGTGVTSCYLARTYGCKVVGTDLSSEMVEKARERAAKEGLSDLVEFTVGNAYNLPFPANSFDLVIAESLTVFLDKRKVYKEFLRVLKPGGRLGDLEMSLTKELTPEIEAQMIQCFGKGTKPLSFEGWVEILTQAGFEYTGIINPQYLKPGGNLIIQEIKKDWIFIGEMAKKIGEPGLIDRLRRNAEFNKKYQSFFCHGLICARKPEHSFINWLKLAKPGR